MAPIAPKSTIETQAFTVRDMQGFWAATANSDLQLHELITLAAYTGCRYSELTLLKKPNLRQVQRDKQDENPASIKMRTGGWRIVGRA